MTKREIIEELLARRQKFTHRESETIVNAMFDAMANSLTRGERIEIRGFGSFAVKKRRARQGRNPKTGQLVSVDAKQIPFFRAGKELRIEVNGAEEAAVRPLTGATTWMSPPKGSGCGRHGAMRICAACSPIPRRASSVSASSRTPSAANAWSCSRIATCSSCSTSIPTATGISWWRREAMSRRWSC